MLSPAAALALMIVAAAPATKSDIGRLCRAIDAEYDISRAEVREAVQAYQKCLAIDSSPNACVEEFEELDFAQDRFEHASEVRTGCRRR